MSLSGKDKKEKSRAERLRAALRENLRRRKAQARSRASTEPAADAPDRKDSPDSRRNPGRN